MATKPEILLLKAAPLPGFLIGIPRSAARKAFLDIYFAIEKVFIKKYEILISGDSKSGWYELRLRPRTKSANAALNDIEQVIITANEVAGRDLPVVTATIMIESS